MCGIIGYVGSRASKHAAHHRASSGSSIRGYDSAGIALLEDDGLEYVRAVGNLQILKDAAGPERLAVARPASATRAGRPTAVSTRRTRIR